ncbi:hypothetical protein [Cupriavidus pampae]|uniref:Uncharacterized protein n=1 Tax=Cupriavidus pampae TaxID=659251 RepID=A0ABM8WJ07_9BURK|nr:hypothetical protein [Cupriavidus pampae]CAG9167399.1 hypothetical protein LMG32289_01381 [Cupriavidus pampae]
MARNLMTDAGANTTASADQPVADAAQGLTVARGTPVPQPASEVLAGAFPQWDLLPATPFLRRVR